MMDPFSELGSILGIGPRYRRQMEPLPGPSGLTPLGVYNSNLSSLAVQFGQRQQDLSQLQAMNLSGWQNAHRSYVDPDRRKAEQELNAFYAKDGYDLPFPEAGLPE